MAHFIAFCMSYDAAKAANLFYTNVICYHEERYPQGIYHKLMPKVIGPGAIHEVCGDNAYRVQLPDECNINGTFNVAHLQNTKVRI